MKEKHQGPFAPGSRYYQAHKRKKSGSIAEKKIPAKAASDETDADPADSAAL